MLYYRVIYRGYHSTILKALDYLPEDVQNQLKKNEYLHGNVAFYGLDSECPMICRVAM